MDLKRLTPELLELKSEVAHSVSQQLNCGYPEEWPPISERDRVGEVFFCPKSLVLCEVVSSLWVERDEEWKGHLIVVYSLEDGERWEGKMGEAWLVEQMRLGDLLRVGT